MDFITRLFKSKPSELNLSGADLTNVDLTKIKEKVTNGEVTLKLDGASYNKNTIGLTKDEEKIMMEIKVDGDAENTLRNGPVLYKIGAKIKIAGKETTIDGENQKDNKHPINKKYDELANADLKGKSLLDADLNGADLTGTDLTNVNLIGADLTNATVNGTILTGALYDTKTKGLSDDQKKAMKLVRTGLIQIKNSGGDHKIRRTYESLRRANNLGGVDLSNADLKNTDFSGSYMQKINLSGSDLTNANLEHCDLHKADLTGADLTDATLPHENLLRNTLYDKDTKGLTDAQKKVMIFVTRSGNILKKGSAEKHGITRTYESLKNANLGKINLSGADLKEVDFGRSYMQLANLSGSDLTNANLEHCDLHKADLTGANLTDATLPHENLLRNASYNEETTGLTDAQKKVMINKEKQTEQK